MVINSFLFNFVFFVPYVYLLHLIHNLVIHFREAAKEYFQKANNYEKLITCCQYLEDYNALASYIPLLPEKDHLLNVIGEIFLNVGMCSQSVDAYIKVSKISSYPNA